MMIETSLPFFQSDSPTMDSTSPELKSSSRNVATRNQLRLIFGYMRCMSVVNLLGPPAVEYSYPFRTSSFEVYFLLDVVLTGFLWSQLFLGAIASVLLPGNLRVRLVLCVIAGVTLTSSIVVGDQWRRSLLSQEFFDLSVISRPVMYSLCILPLGLVSAQLPYWFAKTWLNWRIEHIEERGLASTQLSIRDLMLATAYVGVVVSFARYGVIGLGTELGGQPQFSSDLMFRFAMFAVCTVILSLLTMILVRFCLRSSKANLVRREISVVFAILAVPCVATVTVLLSGAGLNELGGLFRMLIPFAASYSLAVSVPLLIARRMGFELRWGRVQSAVPRNDAASVESS